MALNSSGLVRRLSTQTDLLTLDSRSGEPKIDNGPPRGDGPVGSTIDRVGVRVAGR